MIRISAQADDQINVTGDVALRWVSEEWYEPGNGEEIMVGVSDGTLLRWVFARLEDDDENEFECWRCDVVQKGYGIYKNEEGDFQDDESDVVTIDAPIKWVTIVENDSMWRQRRD